MKPLEEWTEADLQSLVDNGIPESLYLDYKDSRALSRDKTNEISKDVSALANSAGGKLIYGISEAKVEGTGGVPVKIDNGVTDQKITKEWIEQIILSSISPRIETCKIKEIALASSGRAYVVEVAQAVSRAPHQASDKKYYRRANFLSQPMDDYEIRDMLNRGQKPHPYIRFKFGRVSVQNGTFNTSIECLIANAKDEPVLYAAFNYFFDAQLNNSTSLDSSVVKLGFLSVTVDGQLRKMVNFHRNHNPTHHIPIFKEQVCSEAGFSLDGLVGREFLVGYKIACPGFAGSEFGRFTISESGEIQFTYPTPDIFTPILQI